MTQKITFIAGSLINPIIKLDLIINSANHHMMGGGGIDGAIHKAVGIKLRRECSEKFIEPCGKRLPAGSAYLTSPHDLSSIGIKGIIHTHAPKKKTGIFEELISCYYSSFLIADKFSNEKNTAINLSFCGIGAGAYGWSAQETVDAANLAINKINSTNINYYLIDIGSRNSDFQEIFN